MVLMGFRSVGIVGMSFWRPVFLLMGLNLTDMSFLSILTLPVFCQVRW